MTKRWSKKRRIVVVAAFYGVATRIARRGGYILGGNVVVRCG
jgi:hypothetical protein